jgi:hypothetical protein
LATALGADPSAGFDHYVYAGISENRSVTFSGLEYLASYPDLQAAFGADGDAAAAHFISAGRAEGRTVTFDSLQYIASYRDLISAIGANSEAGAAHYIANGAREGRLPDTFDAGQYLANYPDLRAAFGTDSDAATIHYITQGFGEGRTDEPAPTAAALDFMLCLTRAASSAPFRSNSAARSSPPACCPREWCNGCSGACAAGRPGRYAAGDPRRGNWPRGRLDAGT